MFDNKQIVVYFPLFLSKRIILNSSILSELLDVLLEYWTSLLIPLNMHIDLLLPYGCLWVTNAETQALLIAGHLLTDLGFDCVVTPVLDKQWSFPTKKTNQ